MAEWVLWGSMMLTAYAYVGYPLLLAALAGLRRRPRSFPPLTDDQLPSVSMIVPAHNEEQRITAKLKNTAALDYPANKLEVLYVSDGSTDDTAVLIRGQGDARSILVELTTRSGKAAALNAGLERAHHEIVVFSDAAILLSPDAVRRIVVPFASPDVGCVSGEDRIPDRGGEALYGRYELFIRRLEARLGSIVGASGCFYAQRRQVCSPFVPNLAPDFLSVLRTVERGYRAVSEPAAEGVMAAVERSGDEFQRKVRTLLRGMTTLAECRHMLNPVRYGLFAWQLASHKMMRWMVPFLLVAALSANAMLMPQSAGYQGLFLLQAAFYALGLATLAGVRPIGSMLPAKFGAYFLTTNAAVVAAWFKYATGVRQELWSPSQRACPGKPTDA